MATSMSSSTSRVALASQTIFILPTKSFLRTLLMSSILILICSKGVTFGANHCVRNLQSLDRISKPNSPLVLRGQIVIPSYTFVCYGAIKRWDAKINGRILSTIHFQVWRMDSTLKIHRLAGENVIRVNSDNWGLSYSLQGTNFALSVTDPLQQIHVAPGDIVGVFIGNEGNMKIQYEASLDTITFTANVPSPLEGFVNPLLDPAFQSMLNAAPLIGLDMEETADVTTTSMFPTSTKSKEPHTPSTYVPVPSTPPDAGGNEANPQSVPYQLITGVAVSGSILIALCVGLIVVVACYIKAKNRGRISENPRRPENNPPSSHLSMLNLLPSLDTPRRKILMAFKRQQSMRGTLDTTRHTRPVAEVDLNNTQQLAQGDIELSYAYPVTNTSMSQIRSTSAGSSKSLPVIRKPSTCAHIQAIPLPEVPNVIEMGKNPSYSMISTESFDQPDLPESTARPDLDDNVYDVPVFTRQRSAPALEYEIPVSSLSSSSGQVLESSPHVYDTTDGMYSEIFD